MNKKGKKICSRCIYDGNVSGIFFDEKGICNYCYLIESMEAEYPLGGEGKKKLAELTKTIKKSGNGKKYDCVVGVSGGCDSSYLLFKLKELGLRPLAAHFDNTWNSSIATENILNITKKLNLDLFTIVVDNKEYDDIYKSFFKAGVMDIDIPTDVGLVTTLYKAAETYGIKYIIEGHSFRTEGISPLGWSYTDGKYVESVHKKFGKIPMKTFKNLWLKDFLKWILIKRIKKVRPLYYMDYRKEEAKKLLKEKFGWQWYGGHHLENRFTAFVHSYLFPTRFGIDQRVNGYSALVRSGQISRKEGLKLIQQSPKYDPELVKYVKKRLSFSDKEFNQLMKLPIRTYKDYETYKPIFERLRFFFWFMYKLNFVTKSFYVKYTLKD